MVLDTVQHPLLGHGLLPPGLPDRDGDLGLARGKFSSSAGDQLSQLVPGRLALAADEH